MNERVTHIYEEICALSPPEKVDLYNRIAYDFESNDPEFAALSAATPQINVPGWLYRILARWSHA